MSYPEEIIATDLRRAWANFDPYLPLPAGSDFYVHRPGKPLRRLREALLMSQEFGKTPKYFFSGHRGSGKSTEMNRLAANPDLRERFVIIHYSIRDYADVNDLNHIDVLFTLGAQMFMQYTDEDGRYRGKLSPALLKELEGLQGRISEKVRVTNKEGLAESEASLNAYFLKALGKIKQEEISRREIRQILEPRSSEWLQQINLIASNIAGNEQKQVLVIIDDLDKPNLPTARSLFHQHIGLLQQPSFPIIYTVPIAVFYTHQFISISEGRQFLPSIKLYSRDGEPVAANFSLMRQIVGARMERKLITPEALDHIVAHSGGIVRDLTRMLQIGAMEAILGDEPQIDLAAAQRASAELRNEFRRMLTEEDIAILRRLRDGAEAPPEQKAPLLFISAAVEYVNDAAWEDVHPIVRPLLDDEE